MIVVIISEVELVVGTFVTVVIVIGVAVAVVASFVVL